MAVSSVFEIVAGTAKAGADELMLAELQHAIVQPHAAVNLRRTASDRPAVECWRATATPRAS